MHPAPPPPLAPPRLRRRYEDASLRYTGIDSHDGLAHVGGYDTVVALE